MQIVAQIDLSHCRECRMCRPRPMYVFVGTVPRQRCVSLFVFTVTEFNNLGEASFHTYMHVCFLK